MKLSSLIILLLLLGISFFFSLAEMSLVAMSKLRMRHLIARGSKKAKVLQKLTNRMDETITSIVLANNFANTAISTLGAGICIALLGPRWGIPVAAVVMGTLIIALAEITPKVLAIQHPDRVALRLARPIRVMVRLLYPITYGFTVFTHRLLRLFGVHLMQRSPLVTEEEIKLMIEVGREQGLLAEDERTLLHRIFEFGDLRVVDVMRPLAEMAAVPETATHEQVLAVATEEGYSRIPVYSGSKDRIIGVLYSKDMLHLWHEGELVVLKDLLHPPFEVDPDRRVSDLLREFQKRHQQMAIVTDPQKKALGLVTLEDLIEEIVGELEG